MARKCALCGERVIYGDEFIKKDDPDPWFCSMDCENDYYDHSLDGEGSVTDADLVANPDLMSEK